MTSAIVLAYRHIPYIPQILVSLSRKHPIIARYALLSLTGLAVKYVAQLIKRRVPKFTVLEIDLDEKLREHPDILPIFGDHHTLQELIETIEKARTDARVVALCVKVKTTVTLQLAQIQELRQAIERFKEAGKLTVIYTDTFGEMDAATRLYYLASAFNLIFVQQSGAVCLGGPSADSLFIKHTLEKAGITPEISQRKLFKTMANLFNEDKMTPEHREMMESLIGDLYEQVIAGIAAGRKLEVDVVRAKLLKGIHSSTDALDGLVDGARYQDEVYRTLLDHLKIRQSKANFLYWNRYYEKTKGKYGFKNKNKIALIYATGNIHRGPNNPLSDSPSIGSETLCSTIRTAVKDSKVKAIVIRVDSGGGSYVASDSIYHEILAAKNAGKKVVVSMGNVAASGGYFIAMAADSIIAQPATLTGSIGVVSGKFVMKGLWEKFGVTFDPIKLKQPNDDGSGVYNDYYSTLHSYTEGDYIKKREEILDYIYEDFTKKVAFSRKLNRDQVEAAAQGRVWTGKQALELNLIDKLGGIEDAIETAKALADIPLTATPFVQVYPKISVINLLKPAKNREDSDSKGIQANSFGALVDSVSLVSNAANSVAGFINSYCGPILSSTSATSPLSSSVSMKNFN